MKNEDLDKEIRDAETLLANLKARKEAISKSTPEMRLAIKLHYFLCRHNHTDGCGWYYEQDLNKIDLWNEAEHSQYLNMANKFIARLASLRRLEKDHYGAEAASNAIDALSEAK